MVYVPLSSRHFWMTLSLVLALTVGGLCWVGGEWAHQDIRYELHMNGLYQTNERLYVGRAEDEVLIWTLQSQNTSLRKDIKRLGGPMNRKPF